MFVSIFSTNMNWTRRTSAWCWGGARSVRCTQPVTLKHKSGSPSRKSQRKTHSMGLWLHNAFKVVINTLYNVCLHSFTLTLTCLTLEFAQFSKLGKCSLFMKKSSCTVDSVTETSSNTWALSARTATSRLSWNKCLEVSKVKGQWGSRVILLTSLKEVNVIVMDICDRNYTEWKYDFTWRSICV